jgi:integrase
VAKRPLSKASTPVRDVSAAEEAKFLTLAEVATLTTFVRVRSPELLTMLQPISGAYLERSSAAWRELRNLFIARALICSGLRRFEFCALTCGDFVDGEASKLWVVGKGARRNYVPLPNDGAATFREWISLKLKMGESTDQLAPIFCSRSGEFLSFELLRKVWSGVLASAAIPPRRLHASRHTAGLLVLAATGDIRAVGRFLRHDGTAVTERAYAHVDPAVLRSQLQEIKWP